MQLAFTAIGYALGGPLGGAIGSMLGQFLFAEGASAEGPRLDDLKVTTSTYGKPVKRVFGKMRVGTNIIYADDLVEHKSNSKTGSFLSGGEVTEYWYSCTFAVAICEGPISGVNKIWANSTLIYDMTTARGAATNLMPYGYVIYDGSETQQPNATLQGIFGDNVPAHRGLAYIVFPDFDLSNFHSQLPSITVEVVKGSKQWPRIYNELSYTVPNFDYTKVDSVDNNWGSHRMYDGVLEVMWYNKKFNSQWGFVVFQKYDLDTNELLDEDIVSGYTAGEDLVWDNKSAVFAIHNRPDLAALSNDKTVGRQWPWQWMVNGRPMIELAATVSTGVNMTTGNQPDPNYIVNLGGLGGGGAFDEVALWVNNYIVTIAGRDGYAPVYLQFHFAPDGTHSLDPDDTSYEEIIQYGAPNIHPWKSIDVSDEAGVNGSSIRFGYDTELKYLYLALRNVITPSYFTSFEGIVGQPTMIKINPHTGKVVKNFYMDQSSILSTFVVYKDSMIMSPFSSPGRWDNRVLGMNPDNTYEEYTLNYTVYSSTNVTGRFPAPVGENGLIRTEDAIYTLASSVASTTVPLSDVVTTLCSTAQIVAADLEVVELVSTLVDGYAINRQESTRASLETLQKGYIFDVVESDWKLKFKKRK